MNDFEQLSFQDQVILRRTQRKMTNERYPLHVTIDVSAEDRTHGEMYAQGQFNIRMTVEGVPDPRFVIRDALDEARAMTDMFPDRSDEV